MIEKKLDDFGYFTYGLQSNGELYMYKDFDRIKIKPIFDEITNEHKVYLFKWCFEKKKWECHWTTIEHLLLIAFGRKEYVKYIGKCLI